MTELDVARYLERLGAEIGELRKDIATYQVTVEHRMTRVEERTGRLGKLLTALSGAILASAAALWALVKS